MNRIILTAIVDGDGTLHLDLPLGTSAAGNEVQVTVEPVASSKPLSADEWRAFVFASAGSITDPTFKRHPQGDFEEREALP